MTSWILSDFIIGAYTFQMVTHAITIKPAPFGRPLFLIFGGNFVEVRWNVLAGKSLVTAWWSSACTDSSVLRSNGDSLGLRSDGDSSTLRLGGDSSVLRSGSDFSVSRWLSLVKSPGRLLSVRSTSWSPGLTSWSPGLTSWSPGSSPTYSFLSWLWYQ